MREFEVRRVHKDWDHPADKNDYFLPLHDGKSFYGRLKVWHVRRAAWVQSYNPFKASEPSETYTGERPRIEDHMPDWPDAERTHLMMYDVTGTAGYPISPEFERIEDLCRWLAVNHEDFDKKKRNYSEWMKIAATTNPKDDDWYDRLFLVTTAMNAFYSGEYAKYKEVTQRLRRLTAETMCLFEPEAL